MTEDAVITWNKRNVHSINWALHFPLTMSQEPEDVKPKLNLTVLYEGECALYVVPESMLHRDFLSQRSPSKWDLQCNFPRFFKRQRCVRLTSNCLGSYFDFVYRNGFKRNPVRPHFHKVGSIDLINRVQFLVLWTGIALQKGTFRFTYDGQRVNANDTPGDVSSSFLRASIYFECGLFQLNMEEGDQIDAHLGQVRLFLVSPSLTCTHALSC